MTNQNLKNLLKSMTEAEAAQSAFEKQIQAIRATLPSKGTGDPVYDFLIAEMSSFSAYDVNCVKALYERLEQSIGLEVLYADASSGLMKLKLGILNSAPKFDLKNKTAVLPVEKYAQRFCEHAWSLENKDMESEGAHFILDAQLAPDRVQDFRRGFLTGKDVERYFSAKSSFDPTYVFALKLLGRTAPKKFLDAYNKETANLLEELERIHRFDDFDQLNHMDNALLTNTARDAIRLGMMHASYEQPRGIDFDVRKLLHKLQGYMN